jgi:hypothetical protein
MNKMYVLQADTIGIHSVSRGRDEHIFGILPYFSVLVGPN